MSAAVSISTGFIPEPSISETSSRNSTGSLVLTPIETHAVNTSTSLQPSISETSSRNSTGSLVLTPTETHAVNTTTSQTSVPHFTTTIKNSQSTSTTITTMSNSTTGSTSLSGGATLPAIPPDNSVTNVSQSLNQTTSTGSTTSSNTDSTSFSGGATLPAIPPDNSATTVSQSPSQTTSIGSTTSSKQTDTSSTRNSVHPAASTSVSSHASAVTHIITKSGKSSSTTSTITDRPETTLSSAIPITVVDPLDGKSSLSFPAILTLYSTTSEPDGSFVTFTHVVANPTGLLHGGQTATAASGFLSNGGKVAGVFVTVGIVFATLTVLACLVAKRRRKRSRQRRRWIETIQKSPPSPQDPFQDPVPTMVQYGNNGNSLLFTQQREVFIEESGHSYGVLGNKGADRHGFEHQADNLRHLDNREIGLAVSTGLDLELAQYSPSLYPPTLPSTEPEGTDLVMERGTVNLPPAPISNVPPRPPRSLLRETAKFAERYPMTPPSSVSSHEREPEPSPEFDSLTLPNIAHSSPARNDILARPTLLDVRQRTQ